MIILSHDSANGKAGILNRIPLSFFMDFAILMILQTDAFAASKDMGILLPDYLMVFHPEREFAPT